ncbi:MAG: hypothetical protein V3V17_05475, partial [Alphaproteobacteria bacterium]
DELDAVVILKVEDQWYLFHLPIHVALQRDLSVLFSCGMQSPGTVPGAKAPFLFLRSPVPLRE